MRAKDPGSELRSRRHGGRRHHPITRAQVEQNVALKMRDGAFLADLSPLLASGDGWDPVRAEAIVSQRLVALLPGEPWKGEET